MQLFNELFAEMLSTDYGVASFVVIVIVILMGLGFTVVISKKMREQPTPAAPANTDMHKHHSAP